jgi:NADH dehydrogenase FAD-containing subunit
VSSDRRSLGWDPPTSIVEAAATLLVGEGPDAAALVTAALTADGVSVRTGVLVQKVSTADQGWCAELADGSAVARPTCAPAPPWLSGCTGLVENSARRIQANNLTEAPITRISLTCPLYLASTSSNFTAQDR